MRPGDVLDTKHVTVEFNTIFEQLTSVLTKIDPGKLNQTLGAISSALDGRGQRFGLALTDLNALLTQVEPSLTNLEAGSAALPRVAEVYADGAAELLRILDSGSRISSTIIDQQHNLDAVLMSTTGLATVGREVVDDNGDGIARLLRVLAPTTGLTMQYNEAITCGLEGLGVLSSGPTFDKPGVVDSIGFLLGRERYRYPNDLPKVAAVGGSHCLSLPSIPFDTGPPFVVADVGTDQAQYGNQGILLNSDALKQFLFGPVAGPARNSSQIGGPG